jgi:pyridoxamine 5'-phosphate oxidase
MSLELRDTNRTISEIAAWLRSLGSLRGSAPAFDPSDVPEEPTLLFVDWLREAVQTDVREPHATTLATVGTDGIPDARTLILKDVDPITGWAFAGPRSSRKGSQLAASPAAALNFWWQPMMRAVRVRGTVTEADRAETEADLATRPASTVAAADDWMLWKIQPVRIEFWQGAVDRRHVRLVYERAQETWTHRVRTGHSQDGSDGE